MTSELSSLYKNKPIALWVEDVMTASYLEKLWGDSDIKFLVAGGNGAVRAAAQDAREHKLPFVFGFRDRDFETSNRTRWLDPSKNPNVFIPDAFEVENYLLDFAGLAALGPVLNPHSRTALDLEERARNEAKRGHWWMAARATIAEAAGKVIDGFPPHPKLGNPNLVAMADAQSTVEALLLNSNWGTQTAAWFREGCFDWLPLQSRSPKLGRTWIRDRLSHHGALFQACLQSDDWLRSWSGKEVLNHILSYMNVSKMSDDVAKGLAAYQRANGTEPPELLELRAAIRKRAGVDSW